MNTQAHSSHNQEIIDQFTRQAAPFASHPAHTNESAFQLLLNSVRPAPTDTTLDVACGPGLVACALAPHVQHVTGIDLTPAMVELARAAQKEKGLSNLAWQVGDVSALPFPNAAFSLVVTRFTFHHFLDPLAVLREMARVCTPGGKVVVIDVVVAPEKREAYDRMERLRDPSHVRALTHREFHQLREVVGLTEGVTEFYQLEMELERQLASSFPKPGDADRLREWFRADLEKDEIGVGAHLRGEEIYFAYPVGLYVWERPGSPVSPGGKGMTS